MLSGTLLPAQEALRNALLEDKSVLARQVSPSGDTEFHKAGPLQFNMGLSYSGEFNDNVNLSEVQREGDFIQRPQLDVHGFLPVTKTAQLSLGMGIGYEIYADHSELNTLFLNPDSEVAYDFSAKDFTFTFYDRFTYSKEVESVGALSGVAQFPRLENSIGTRVTWAPSRWTYQAGYTHSSFITSGTSGNDFSYLDRSSEQFFARVAYGFAPATQAGLETSVALTDYVSTTRADNNSYSVGPYVEWQVTEALTLSVHGGLTYLAFDSVSATPTALGTASYSLNTYYASLQINQHLTQFISHGLSLVHEVEPGVNEGSDYLESTHGEYRANWSMTQNMTVGMNFQYEHGTEGSVAAVTQQYDRFGAGFSASRKLSARLTAGVAYNYWRRISKEGGGDYYQNQASISLRYQF
jgi:hypothetical protein